ncbi:hypothetical protein ANN_01016 [Periplaneta americana]|uniref:Uncharacterized protein n=1 Tax=Periplaneta americana TaxID=6978 RepID=A0ABQ8TUV7_PERAM|nr:hypothetical protein ANN_01016 [Periplaneta americana]
MAGLCEGSNERASYLKAICKETKYGFVYTNLYTLVNEFRFDDCAVSRDVALQRNINSQNKFVRKAGKLDARNSWKKRNLTPLVKTVYQHYFGMRIVYEQKKNSSIPESSICFRSIPHSDSLLVPTPPENCVFEVEHEDSMEQEEPNTPSTSHDPDFEEKDDKPHRMSQAELSDLIRDLDLSKEKAEILGLGYSNGIFSNVMSGSHSTDNVTGICFPFLRRKTILFAPTLMA